MALVFVSTAGGADSNSGASVEELDAYLEGRPEGAAFLQATTAVKQLYLAGATSRLEQETYQGRRATTTQRLKFPRSGAYDDDGAAYAVTAMPRPYTEAVCEQALYMWANAGTDTTAATGLEAFTSLSVPGVTLQMRNAIPATVSTGLAPQVIRLLAGLRTSGGMTTRLVRA